MPEIQTWQVMVILLIIVIILMLSCCRRRECTSTDGSTNPPVVVAPPGDVTPPGDTYRIISTTPGSDAKGILLDTTISAVLSSNVSQPPTARKRKYLSATPGDSARLLLITIVVKDSKNNTISGVMTYDTATNTAIFTPSSKLEFSTTYTASIASPVKVWSFTTRDPLPPNVSFVVGPVLKDMGVFGGSAGMTNDGLSTVVNGNIATTGTSTKVTGFYDKSLSALPDGTYPNRYTVTGSNFGLVKGMINTAAPPPTSASTNEGNATTAKTAADGRSDTQALYDSLKLKPVDFTAAQNLAGKVLPPGVYKFSDSASIIGSDLTLDGKGEPNSVWVFQIPSSLTVGDPTLSCSVKLINRASAANVFWIVGAGATINGAGGGTMVGTIIAYAGISVSTTKVAATTTIEGRLCSLSASVTLNNTVINVPGFNQ
jgi:hypothetical protein